MKVCVKNYIEIERISIQVTDGSLLLSSSQSFPKGMSAHQCDTTVFLSLNEHLSSENPESNRQPRSPAGKGPGNEAEQQANRLTDEPNRSPQDKQSVQCPNLHKLVSFLSETAQQQQFRTKYEENTNLCSVYNNNNEKKQKELLEMKLQQTWKRH